uniref:Uncharacterized protein n=1 Tax=Cacopsylla melanoneura TaxID=428564 RepID=A0A8D8LY16_9HEMI
MECRFCLKSFDTKNKHRRHVIRCTKDPDFQPFVCHSCNTALTRKCALLAHISKDCSSGKNPCPVSNCSFTYYFRNVLVEHLKVSHGQVLKPEENLVFQNQSSFLKWKNYMESKTFSYYSLHCGEKKGYSYYYCQFDGSSRSHTKADADTARKRKTNSKGRVKTGSVCTSSIKVKKQENGSLLVTFLPSHCHEVSVSNLKYQPLNAETYAYIDQQIYLGVPLLEIRERLKNKFPGVNRTDFITMKSLRERRRRLLKHQNFENEETDYLDSIENVKMNYMEKIQSINTELMECINSENFPEHLLPHIEDVLSKLLTECSQGEKMSQEVQPQAKTSPGKQIYQQVPGPNYIKIETQSPIINKHGNIIPHEHEPVEFNDYIIEEVYDVLV